MKEGFLKLFVLLMTVVLMFVMALLTAFGYGLTIHLLWAWFMVPILGLPVFPVIPASGLAILILLLTGSPVMQWEPSVKINAKAKEKRLQKENKEEESKIAFTPSFSVNDDKGRRVVEFHPLKADHASEFWLFFREVAHQYFYSAILIPTATIGLGWFIQSFM